MQSQFIQDLIKPYRTISIIGLEKNVGKTTTLNDLIRQTWQISPIGLTSIGRDGEKIDTFFNNPKPRIYIKKGSFFATSRELLNRCDVTKEILETTGINTPLGEIVLIRALSNGYVELAGPSQTRYLADICHSLLTYGSQYVFVDGAISRKTLAAPTITDATIIATGAAVHINMDEVIQKTVHLVKLLTWPQIEDPQIIDKIQTIPRIGIIDNSYNLQILDIPTTLHSIQQILPYLSENTHYLIVKGVITDEFLEVLMKQCSNYSNFTIIIEDGTKLFLSEQTINKFEKTGGKLKVIREIRVLYITINPKSPDGNDFDPSQFLDALRLSLSIPIINLCIGGNQ